MFQQIWESINPYFFILIAVPCMGMFPFRFPEKMRIPLVLFVTLLTCLLKYGLILLTDYIFPNLWGSTLGFFLHQMTFILSIYAASIFLYQGDPFSMLLVILLGCSLAHQVGFLLGSLGNLFFFNASPLLRIVLRDLLGYGSYLAYYLLLRRHLNMKCLYLTMKDHAFLLAIGVFNFLLACYSGRFMFESTSFALIIFPACLATTVSTAFLIFRFTKEHELAMKRQLQIQDMKLAENTLSQIQEASAQIHELKHELSNYLIYARSLLKKGSYIELDKYLASLSQNSLMEELPIATNNPVVNSILNQKNAYAHSMGIKTEMHVSLPDSLPIANVDLCSLFGNLLNNAIEGCKDQPDPFLKLTVCPVKSYLVIYAENSVDHDVIKENPNLFTTKRDSEQHGIGMRVIYRLIRQYDGIIHYEMTAPDRFSIQIMLKI